ncbi:MAG: hypothetical protein R3F43_01325 [bacterium]
MATSTGTRQVVDAVSDVTVRACFPHLQQANSDVDIFRDANDVAENADSAGRAHLQRR